MTKIIFPFILTIFINYSVNAQNKKIYKVSKTAQEWKILLTNKQYYVLREAGTEQRNSSFLNDNYKKGIYVCAACKTPLYKSVHKYNSGSGWPAFDRAITKNIALDVDYKIGYARTELKCNTCGGHLGHLFNDGPKKTTGMRHCINGTALSFIPKK
ncbi:peptide-methionine (R)-S-oxide reductase MsrB [Tenacibaculum aestuariivivum]|uniref:peptide-methionine (R)-S-oxide reductase MsrB n=1 Tax=Tenacibaculum aestuariivivum TaxID=2006131 RepID=UPI003AB25FC5